MNHDTIIQMWREESLIDQTEISNELERTYQLHAKYIDLLKKEKSRKKKLEDDYKCERREAFEFYSQGPSSKDTTRKQPAIGRIIPANVSIYMDADEELQRLSTEVNECERNIETLTSIVSHINYRNNTLGNVLSWIKWSGGG